MNPLRTLATTGRVLVQIRNDPRTIALLLIVPSLLIGLVAWIFDETDVFSTIGPAMLALFPFIVMFLVTSIATLRERRSGTLERLLSMPLGRGDFILGYTLAFGLLAIVQTAVAVGYATMICGLEIEGSVGLLFVVAIADALLGTALGTVGQRVRPHGVPGRAVHARLRLPADPARRDLPPARPAARGARDHR